MTQQTVEAEVVVLDWATEAAWEIFDKSHGLNREPFLSVDIANVIRRHAPRLGPPRPKLTEAEADPAREERDRIARIIRGCRGVLLPAGTDLIDEILRRIGESE